MSEHHELTAKEHASLHQALLTLLLEFDRICRLAGIPYQLGAGTLLGAVRHHGFIPWDDDGDVCMLRTDYESFLNVAPSLLGPEFYLQHKSEEPKYPHLFAKLRLNDTEFITPEYQNLGIHQGIYIDIFPFDEVKPHQLLGRIHFGVTHYVFVADRSLLASRYRSLGARRSPLIRKIFGYCQRILNWIGQDRLDRLTHWLARFYFQENQPVNSHFPEYVTCLVSGGSSYATQRMRIRRFKDFTNTIPFEFCGHPLPIPANYDEVLTGLYGNYKQLPPAENRRPIHHIVRFRVKNNNHSS